MSAATVRISRGFDSPSTRGHLKSTAPEIESNGRSIPIEMSVTKTQVKIMSK